MPAPDTGDRAPRGTGSPAPDRPAPDLPAYPDAAPDGSAGAVAATAVAAGQHAGRQDTAGQHAGAQDPAGQDTAGQDTDRGARPGPVAPAGPWPTVRPATARTVAIRRALAVLALVYGVAVYWIATDVLSRAEHLLAGVVVGGLLNLVGVVLLWLYAQRTPARVEPARGPDMGLVRDRAVARKVLRSGLTPDGEQRRLVAVDVLADAPVPLITGGTFALLGPLVVAVAHDSGPFGWAGPLTAGLIVVVLALVGVRAWRAYALHKLADAKHTVPRFEESGTPWQPWP
ncbi:hypothetical protein [Pseudonocardia phyllosphaerae]|uniref:hypothetical protein n=1 Tax=Pseudonocardia phyllosphaerae TaxID=3390502 RepID=UPI00397A5404